jgi:outer membrane protein
VTRSLSKSNYLVNTAPASLKRAAGAKVAGLLLCCLACSVQAQTEAPPSTAALPNAAVLRDYTNAVKVFPHIRGPYRSQAVPGPDLSNAANVSLTVQDGKVRLSLTQLIAAVVENNLTVASARYYVPIAQTDLLRARSGASPRGVDASAIPSAIFAGAQGGSILGTAGGGSGGASNAGGITGAASSVRVSPSGLFDPTLSATWSLDRTPSPLNTLVVAGIPSVTNTTFAWSVNYIQAFSSGTSFTASYGFQEQKSTQLHLLYNPDYTPGFTATISQQMVNGFGFKVNRALIEVAQNEQKIERESFRQQVVTTLVSAENAYWDMIAAQEAVHAAEEAVTVAQRLEDNNRRELRVGLMAPLDVITAQSQVASSQRDLIIAQTNRQYAELQLKNMLSKNLEEPFASAAIEATDTFPEPDTAQLPTLDQAVATANSNRPEISVAQGNIKSQQDVLPFLKNALLPSVNIFALVNTVGLYNLYSTSSLYLLEAKYPQFAFGVSISFPLHNRQAIADDIHSRLELQQSRDTLVRTQSQIEVDVQNALIAVTQGRAQVTAARAAVRLAEQQLDAEQKRLVAGLSTSYNVILIQRDLFTAQLAEVQARDAYAKARVNLDQATGVTLENRHISLDDALRGTLATQNASSAAGLSRPR